MTASTFEGNCEIGRKITDEVCGPGSYAWLNWDHPDPIIRKVARRGYDTKPEVTHE